MTSGLPKGAAEVHDWTHPPEVTIDAHLFIVFPLLEGQLCEGRPHWFAYCFIASLGWRGGIDSAYL